MSAQFINGRLSRSKSGESSTVINPATGEDVTQIDLASAEDVNEAVAVARTAFGEWSRTTPGERSSLLYKFARLVDAHADELAELETHQAGKPIRLTTEFDVPGTIDNIDFFAGAARNLEGKASAEYSPDHTSSIRREPLGVVGSIAPWNYPLQMAAWKILPAVAAGNTIVLKPAEITPLTSLRFAELATQAGIPAGVINVVVGRGSVAGDRLIHHDDVDMVSFTGSTGVGRRVLEAAAVNAKRVHLELGGKAPFVVFDDADLEAAIHGAVAGSLINGGQDCTAATRAIVHRSVYKQFVEGVAELFAKVKVGATNDPATDMGSLISFAHRDSVAGFVERARGYANVVVGGAAPGGDLAHGAYYLPTLIADVQPGHEVWTDEIFGPVLTVTPFDTDDEAIALANDTVYGLAASVWTKDVHRSLRGTREIKAGCVWVNDHIPIISEMPHGGVKQSGFGKDMSQYSLDEYTAVKHVMFDITGDAQKSWHRTIFSV
jgi:betaine-aldehyde dehydrogenase